MGRKKIQGSARSDDSASAKKAARDVNVRKGWAVICGVLFHYSRPRDNYPMACVEIHSYIVDTFPYIDQITSRMHELVERGYISERGQLKRASRSGLLRLQKVYNVTDDGIALWRSYDAINHD